MAPKPVTLTFAGDSQSLERTFDKVGAGAKEMASDMDAAAAEARGLAGSMDTVSGASGTAETSMMGTADILDGLGAAFGLPTEAATGLLRGFGDLTGGLSTIGGQLAGAVTWLKNLSIVTRAQTAVQWLMNAAMSANPIGLVVIALAALVGAFVLAWTHSETFRNIVTGAMERVRAGVEVVLSWFGSLWDFISKIPGWVGGAFSGLAETITWPFRTAFDGVKRLWNSTVGGFGIPSIDVGPFSTPGFTIPRMHMGGTVPGNPGNPVPIVAMAGETVGRAGGGAGGVTVVKLVLDGRELTEVVHDGLLTKQRRGGGLGFEAV
jgi:phage-related protein